MLFSKKITGRIISIDEMKLISTGSSCIRYPDYMICELNENTYNYSKFEEDTYCCTNVYFGVTIEFSIDGVSYLCEVNKIYTERELLGKKEIAIEYFRLTNKIKLLDVICDQKLSLNKCTKN